MGNWNPSPVWLTETPIWLTIGMYCGIATAGAIAPSWQLKAELAALIEQPDPPLIETEVRHRLAWQLPLRPHPLRGVYVVAGRAFQPRVPRASRKDPRAVLRHGLRRV